MSYVSKCVSMLFTVARRGVFSCSLAARGNTTGSVKWFNDKKGFGFITMANEKDAFVHNKEIKAEGFRGLRPGMKVSFDLAQDQDKLIAKNVTSTDGSAIVLPSKQNQVKSA